MLRQLLGGLHHLRRVQFCDRLLGERRVAGRRAFLNQAGFVEARTYGTEAVGSLGMAAAGIVFEEERVGVEEGHGCVLSSSVFPFGRGAGRRTGLGLEYFLRSSKGTRASETPVDLFG